MCTLGMFTTIGFAPPVHWSAPFSPLQGGSAGVAPEDNYSPPFKPVYLILLLHKLEYNCLIHYIDLFDCPSFQLNFSLLF